MVIACQKKNTSLIRTLISYKGDVSGKYESLGNPLIKACLYGNREIIKILLKRKADPKIFNNKKNSALHCCIEKNDIKTTKDILSKKYDLDVNAVGYEDNQTPLGLACYLGSLEMVNILLENNANPNIKTKNSSRTCLDEAFDSLFNYPFNLKIINLLIKKGFRENGILSKDNIFPETKILLEQNFKRVWFPEIHTLFPYRVQEKIQIILLSEYRLRNTEENKFYFLEKFLWEKIIYFFASQELMN